MTEFDLSPGQSSQGSSDEPPLMPPPVEDVDLEALAEKVVALLKKELQLERERRGWRVW